MSPGEREQAISYYRDRQYGSQYDGLVRGGKDWVARWHQLRATIRNPAPPRVSPVTNGELLYDPDNHQFVLNCADDAYRTALHTLEIRRGRFGTGSGAFQSWLSAQDAVFSNCDGTKLSLPADPSPDLPLVIRQDRDYQIAAALFYADHGPEALTRFRKIAGDHSSPWSGISNYLIARTLYRMGKDEQVKQEAARILADPSLSIVHGMTWNLMERAGQHARDQDYFVELAHLLSARGQEDGFREELWNYTDIYDGIIGSSDPNREFWFGKDTGPLDEGRFRSVPMTDWIHSFQARDSATHARTIGQWKRTHSAPWLLAAMVHAKGKDPDAPALIEAAARIPPQSPAYLTATWHRIRLTAERGGTEEGRDELDAILKSPELQNMPSDVNLFRSLRMVAAVDFRDFLRFSLRDPALVVLIDNLGEVPDERSASYIRSAWKPHAALDHDAATLLNFNTPFDLLEQAALTTDYPAELHQEIVMTAFTRGLMLDRDLTQIATAMASAAPELQPLITQWRNAATTEEKRFVAAFLLLHRPEARPYLEPGISRHSRPGNLDRYRDNWWCPMDVIQPLQKKDDEVSRAFVFTTPVPAFLEADTKKTAEEIAKVEAQGNGPEFLGRIVLSWAKEHPDDARVPEALHQLVVATHFGCADIHTSEVSKLAFQALQRGYPNSEWAKRTPYWYQEFIVRDSLKR